MATKKAVGRPPKYKSKEEIEEKIDAYFKQCEGEVLKDNNGNTVFNKFGNPVIINQRPPTVTGLALALGFSTRLSLLNYQGKKEFMNTITRAKARVEAYAEERLFDRDGSSGAQFSLRNNFKGWTEKTELDEEEQQARIEQIRANTARMSGGDGDEDEGVEIINDAPKEASEDIGDHNPEVSADI
ncbi:terminase small subunit [[Ruminococcus] lactaris]|uniref:terminase small subunit n=1 Tax=[Ruminococcus] lactaris TaxID=46228 RepID=UPI0032C0FEC6